MNGGDGEPTAIRAGDGVREPARLVPPGCSPWRGVATSVDPDGWVCVRLGEPDQPGYAFARPPGEVELDASPEG